MGKIVDLKGQRFGRLLVIEYNGKSKTGKAKWLCRCDCGNEKIIISTSLKQNETKSCGCLRKEIVSHTAKKHAKHNKTKTRIYRIWSSMKQRCYYKSLKQYKNYGGRGIEVCEEWKKDFMNFYNWAMNNGYEEHLTLDRIDSNKNYCPENCRWATYKEQENNRRNNRKIFYKNDIYTISELSNLLNIPYATLLWRINNYWTDEELSLNVNLNNRNIRRKIKHE